MDTHKLKVTKRTEDERGIVVSMESTVIEAGRPFAKLVISFNKRVEGKVNPDYPSEGLEIGADFELRPAGLASP